MDKPITLYCDNSGAVANSKESCSHKRGKYLERNYHLIREIINRGDVTIHKDAVRETVLQTHRRNGSERNASPPLVHSGRLL